MPFLTDETFCGELVCLKKALPEDAARILEAWDERSIRSSWRHHKPMTVEEERAYIDRHLADDDDYLFLVLRRSDGAILGTLGFYTNTRKEQTDENRFGPGNHRVARLAPMLFSGENELGGSEREAIRLLLDVAFRQVFEPGGFRLGAVYVLVLEEDAGTVGELSKLGFVKSHYRFPYHGKTVTIMDYCPLEP